MSIDLTHALDLARGPDAAARVFAYAVEGLRRDVGSRLTTASTYDLVRMRSRRVFTDNAEAYPIGNFKTMERNRFFETLIEGRQPFSSASIEEMATAFFDWRKIQALGCESNLNLPAIADDRVIGTVNLLDRAGHYTPARIDAALAWQPVLVLAFLLLELQGRETATFHSGLSAPSDGVVEG
jgi:hypothetical protein